MRIAFVIPAYNEEGAIGKTIKSAFECIPGSKVYVCDNNSNDSTRSEAIKYGAKVINEPKKGKGNAVKKREETHKMAEANRAFSHFRW